MKRKLLGFRKALGLICAVAMVASFVGFSVPLAAQAEVPPFGCITGQAQPGETNATLNGMALNGSGAALNFSFAVGTAQGNLNLRSPSTTVQFAMPPQPTPVSLVIDNLAPDTDYYCLLQVFYQGQWMSDPTAATPVLFHTTAGGEPSGKVWTVMVYMAADNDLDDEATADLAEMQAVGSSDDINIVAMVDRPGDSNTSFYYVESDALTPIPNEFPAEWNMGDPGSLSIFASWMRLAYPAEHYAIILWNHGSGWRSVGAAPEIQPQGIAFDDFSEDYLTTVELGNVFAALTAEGSEGTRYFDLVGFDACLMGAKEIADELNLSSGRKLGVMVASEDVEPGAGWPYTEILTDLNTLALDTNKGGDEFGQAIVDAYHAHYETPSTLFSDNTMASTNMMAMVAPPTQLPVDVLAQALMNNGDAGLVGVARGNTESYDTDYIDLYDFAYQVELLSAVEAVDDAANGVIWEFGNASVYSLSGTGNPNAHGLSIYFPFDGATYALDQAEYAQLQTSQATNWNEMLDWYFDMAPSEEPTWTEIINDPSGDQYEGVGPDIVGVDAGTVSETETGIRVRFNEALDYATFRGMTFFGVGETIFTGDFGGAPPVGSGSAVFVGIMAEKYEADAYEPDNTDVDAVSLALDTAYAHTFHVGGDVDWSYFTTFAGTAYIIETFDLAEGTDTTLTLYDSLGNELVYNDDWGDVSSHIEWMAPADGTYYVLAEELSGDTGAYSLQMYEGATYAPDAYEPDDIMGEAGSLTLATAYDHNFHSMGDVDWGSFSAVNGTSYVIETLNLGVGTDTELELYDGAGNPLDYNDDYGGYPSLIAWTAPADGTYYIRVNEIANRIGTYSWRVSEGVPPTLGAVIKTAKPGAGDKTLRPPVEPVAMLMTWNTETDMWDAVEPCPLNLSEQSYWFTVPTSIVGESGVMQTAGYIDLEADKYIETDSAPDQAPFVDHGWFMLIDDTWEDNIPDIMTVKAYRESGQVGFFIMTQNVDLGDVYGHVYLDTDQDATTGYAINAIGADYAVEFATTATREDLLSGRVYGWDGTDWVAGVDLPIKDDGISNISFDLPLVDLGGDEGNMDVVVDLRALVGAVPSVDVAPDADANPSFGTIGEPPWQLLGTDDTGDAAGRSPDITGLDFAKWENMAPPDGFGGGPIPPGPTVTGGINFRVRATGLDYGNVWGDTYLDVDQNPDTGSTEEAYAGADYCIDVYNQEFGVVDAPPVLVGELWYWDSTLDTPDWVEGPPVGVFTGTTPEGESYYWFSVNYEDISLDGVPDDGYMDVLEWLATWDGLEFDLAPSSGWYSISLRTLPEAIEDGIAWLVAQQDLSDPESNPEYGAWPDMYALAKTAFAVYKLETYAAELGVSPFSDDFAYKANVEAGLDYIFLHANTVSIGAQPAGDPDGDPSGIGAGIGVFFDNLGDGHSPEEGRPIYNASICGLAITAGGDPTQTVDAIGSPLNGWTYGAVAQNLVDYLAWGQTDFGFGRGGWNYWAMDREGDRGDESNAGWATLALAYAEEYGIAIPGFVRTELDEYWIPHIQDDPGIPTDASAEDDKDGGAYYTGPNDGMGCNILRTGNLLQQMAFVGDLVTRPRVQAALDFIERHWNDVGDPGWEIPFGGGSNYHATYTAMKGLEAFGVVTLPGGTDWYADFTDVLLSEQNTDGSWMSPMWDTGDGVLSTEWALLTLEREIPETREGPDLAVTEKHETWVDQPGGAYTIYFTIENKGNLPVAAGWEARVSVNDYTPITLTDLPELAAGESYQGQVGPEPFNGILGDGDQDRIIIIADWNQAVEELNENNNVRVNFFPGYPADLVVTEKYETWTDETETAYDVHYTVRNIGGAIVPWGVTVGLIVDDQGMIETQRIPMVLEPGATFSGVFNGVTFSPPADQIHVVVDVTQEVEESDEGNNEKVNTWPEAGDLPDLVVLEKHEAWVEGQPGVYDVYFTIKNEGAGAVPAGSQYGVRLEVDQQTVGVMPVDAALQPGDTWNGVFEEITFSPASDIIVVRVDPGDTVAESDETNNSMANTLNAPVALPDLTVTEKSEEWKVGNPGHYDVHFTIKNLGPGPVPQDVSYNASLTVDDQMVGTLPVNAALAVDGTWSGTFLNVTFSPESDEITVTIDPGQAVEEADETNNSLTNTLDAPVVALPDLVITEKYETWTDQSQTQYVVHFTVQNIGEAATGDQVSIGLLVNSTHVATYEVGQALDPQETFSGEFPARALSGAQDVIRVVADYPETIDESDETNNTMDNTWPSVTVQVNAPAFVSPGQSFVVNVDIGEVTALDACNYTVSFDPAVLQLTDITAGDVGGVVIPVDIWNEVPVGSGNYVIVQNVPGLAGATGAGYLAQLHFTVLGDIGASTAITLSDGTLGDADAENIPAQWVGDFVEVSVKRGDANGDGRINALDITKVERIIAGLDTVYSPGADANGDGRINALDITKVERFIAGLDTQ